MLRPHVVSAFFKKLLIFATHSMVRVTEPHHFRNKSKQTQSVSMRHIFAEETKRFRTLWHVTGVLLH